MHPERHDESRAVLRVKVPVLCRNGSAQDFPRGESVKNPGFLTDEKFGRKGWIFHMETDILQTFNFCPVYFFFRVCYDRLRFLSRLKYR